MLHGHRKTDSPQIRKRGSLLENEVRTADDPTAIESGKHRTGYSLEDQQRNSSMNDRPAEGDIEMEIEECCASELSELIG